ncbi:fumarylacetoacetate hydrolase family protein [Paraburkholderia sp. J41]|uniref:fumarylacetoacetate hydrolase family protein n=1 Tax=Paraburkholderia sp. J41 TaxID=2805433 RepID=UPI002AC36697|nr:fumarylacetoacetate hydrolase family protein [Paraburkholderia sp. J41]
MKLATFVLQKDPHTTRIGLLANDALIDIQLALLAISPLSALPIHSLKHLLELGDDGMKVARAVERHASGADRHMLAAASFTLDEIAFLPPVTDAGKFLCVGKNYRTHLAELERTGLIKEKPAEPTGFIKLNSCLTGHRRDVVRPATVTKLDYEPELVFVIGKRAFEVAPESGLEYVAGITLLNDLTCRDTQKREVVSGSRFWTGKNAPGFGPLGPYLITLDEVPDPYDLWVSCSVNGEQRMRVNTSEQIWRLPAIIAHFSRLMPLEPGDMISTGAPGGVAVGKENAESLFLKPGDVVECAFESPQMVLSNRIIAPH